jgi:amino acid transporter
VFTDYGYTVLALICAFVFGAVVVLLVLFIIYKVRRRIPFAGGAVKPVTLVDVRINCVLLSFCTIETCTITVKCTVPKFFVSPLAHCI